MRQTYTIESFVSDVMKMIDVGARDSYTNAQIAHYVKEGLLQLRTVRPASRYNAKGGVEDVAFPSGDSELLAFSVNIEERWRLGVVYFALARCHEVGISDSVNLQLAQALRQQADAVFKS